MRIFLIRHGESLGQVDESAYARLMDSNVPLTSLGRQQARAAGAFLKKFLRQTAESKKLSSCYNATADKLAESDKVRIWFSPFLRAVETKDELIEGLGKKRVKSSWEDFMLREQNFGLFSHITDTAEQKLKFPEEYKKYEAEKALAGKFYAVPPMGESRANVAERARIFVQDMMEIASRGNEDLVIVAHGVSLRAIEMAFMHRTVSWFEKEPNPGNCDITMIEGGRACGGYKVSRIYESPKDVPGVSTSSPGKKRRLG